MPSNSGAEPLRPPHARWRGSELWILAMLLVAAAVVLARDITVGGLRHGDSAVHAMDGVLIRDWLAAGPQAWKAPFAFAEEQYAHYPTLGIGRHYPPGFAVVEAVFFGVLGISPVTARLCVVICGMIAVAGTYVFVRSFASRSAAALAACALLALPATTRWGRQVMLEIPTLAVLVWAAVALTLYLRGPSCKRLIVLLALSLTAITFKQPAVFFMGALAVTLLMGAWRGVVPVSHAITATSVTAIAAVATVLLLDGHGAQLLRGDASFPDRWSFAALSYYLAPISRQVGPWILGGAAVGLFVTLRRTGRYAVFLLAWFLACYAMLTLADYKNTRFLYLGLFPFAVFAGMGIAQVFGWLGSSRASGVLGAAAAVALCFGGWTAPVEHRPDYGVVVAAHVNRIAGRAVLFSGLRDGDFVFAVRQHLPWRNAAVVRGSKLFYTCNGRPDLDFVSGVSSLDDVRALMDRLSFRSVFVERENKLDLVEDALFRTYLERGEVFRKVASRRFDLGPVRSYRNVTLDVYEATESRPRSAERLDILIPRAGRTVSLDLTEWS